jgi:hypothetical protein
MRPNARRTSFGGTLARTRGSASGARPRPPLRRGRQGLERVRHPARSRTVQRTVQPARGVRSVQSLRSRREPSPPQRRAQSPHRGLSLRHLFGSPPRTGRRPAAAPSSGCASGIAKRASRPSGGMGASRVLRVRRALRRGPRWPRSPKRNRSRSERRWEGGGSACTRPSTDRMRSQWSADAPARRAHVRLSTSGFPGGKASR